MKIIANTTSPKMTVTKAFNLLSLEYTAYTRVINSTGSVSYTTIQDRVYTSYPTATSVTDYQMNLMTIGQKSNIDEKIIWSSSNTSVATVNSNGYVTHVSDGNCNITAYIDGKSLSKTLNFSTTNIASTSFTSYANSSLAQYIVDTISAKVLNKSASISKNIFSLQNHSQSIYVRNTSCWAYGLDLTCFSPWNSLDGPRRAGTLISPRHVICAQHYPLTVGTTIRFVRLDNTIVNKTITDIYNLSNADIQIALLDSDVGPGVSFAKILPENWFNYLPSIYSNSTTPYWRNYTFGLPALCLDQEEKALILDFVSFTFNTRNTSFSIPNNSKNAEFYENIIVGDSGNPEFLIINNTLVILSTWLTIGSGPFITFYKTQINDAMSQLGGNYQLTEIDLSSFNTY